MNYGFKCKDCGKSFIIQMSISEYSNNKHKCLECKSKNITREYSPVSVIYQGEGFTKASKNGGSEI